MQAKALMTVCYAIVLDRPAEVRADYAIRLLLEGIGVAARRTEATSDADLVYGAERPPDLADQAVWIPTRARNDWDVFAGELDPPGETAEDIVWATYVLVTGAWERRYPRNAFGVPLLGRQPGPWTRPIVATYCERLTEMFEHARRRPLRYIPRWPNGKKYAIVLSHDVDAPFMRAEWSFYLRRLGRNLVHRDLRAAVHGMLQAAKVAKETRFARLPLPADDPNFNFDEWAIIEGRVPAASCFFVAVTSSDNATAAPNDVTYDFRHPELVAALRRTISSGSEVGLHVSINARRRPGGIQQERALLESVLDGYEVRGSRHHYWALDPDVPERTLWEHVRAGLAYDSSLGLNDSPGFRRGIPWPFQPFDWERGEECPILEIPPTLMDGGIFYQRVTPEEGRQQIREHFSQAKDVGGAVVLDWHLEQLNPARLNGAGAALRAELADLASDSDAYWASPTKLAAWWQLRRTLIESSD